jgi:hypothetical protein
MMPYSIQIAYSSGQQQKPAQAPPKGSPAQEKKGASKYKDIAKRGRELSDMLDKDDMDDLDDSVENDPAQDYVLEKSGQ